MHMKSLIFPFTNTFPEIQAFFSTFHAFSHNT